MHEKAQKLISGRWDFIAHIISYKISHKQICKNSIILPTCTVEFKAVFIISNSLNQPVSDFHLKTLDTALCAVLELSSELVIL